jgi:hypothetical protein
VENGRASETLCVKGSWIKIILDISGSHDSPRIYEVLELYSARNILSLSILNRIVHAPSSFVLLGSELEVVSSPEYGPVRSS